ncbi:uroporphyrinogen-III C-methyltransferase [Eubacteriales bacterium KG127]
MLKKLYKYKLLIRNKGINMKNGIVILVGAGPGDKELLTLAALKEIESAEVVVYDRLVSKEIMDLVPESAKFINVGKNVGDHPVPQERISEILAEEAKKGQRVVRLKGGDPFLFGRGGEELELLVENGVEFKVIPGITSSIGAATYGGIPVTHRDFCSSVHMITGKGKRGTDPNINFPALVQLDGTLIFMMSVGSIDYISKGLLDVGMDPKMPCGIVENGTRTYQRKVISTLDNLASDVAKEKIKSPALIIVGKVCQLSDDFDWFSRQPLKGKRILVTQPKAKASKLGDMIKNLGGEAILYPVIKTEKFKEINPPIDDYKLLAFTSNVGVEAFFENLIKSGKDARCLNNKIVVAVGSQTAKALQAFGIVADMVPSRFDGETMAKEIIEKGLIAKDEGILLLRAERASEETIKVLEDAGMRFLDYPVYRTNYVNHEPIDLEQIDWITFTSKSCVEGLLETQNKESLKGKKAISIGRQTEELAKEAGFETIVSDEATVISMVEKLVEVTE